MRNYIDLVLINLVLLIVPWMPCAAEMMPADGRISHTLEVMLFPDEHRISVKDTIRLSDNSPREILFRLHAGLSPASPTPGVKIRRETGQPGIDLFESFSAVLPEGLQEFALEYQGKINHPLEAQGSEQARGFRDTPGIISAEGVFLSGSSYWYPAVHRALVTFDLQVVLPAEWDAVSQGRRSAHGKGEAGTIVRWESPEPQEEIYLIAARFFEYSRRAGEVTAMAFLRKPDDALANKYLEATSRYIVLYEKLIGPYPYKKFALVENFWETGFGMPSFTLLGPTVIRLPFIINSSYPHEILHNWWGNSVFPDYGKGNWSEGLTAYLSDHLIREQQGGAAEYRQTTLQKYADYVLSDRDFPLTEFRSRHSSSSEAVGYGKSLMFFHMLRQELGDRTFVAGLQDFYRGHTYRYATFDDLQKSFEKVSRKKLGTEFDQWVKRRGAPKIRLSAAGSEKAAEGYRLSLVIDQIVEGDAYSVQIPLAVTMEGETKAWQTIAHITGRNHTFTYDVPSRPVRVDLDPEFDLFRRLDLREVPPAITQALGAERMLVVLPSSAPKRMQQAYREFSLTLAKSGPDEVEVKLDRELEELPSDRAVAVLGWENRFIDAVRSALSGYDLRLERGNFRINKTALSDADNSVVLAGRNPGKNEMAVLFIASGLPEALPGLSRKLPHYHKYSYLVFEGGEPANILKGRWPVLDSPMTVMIPYDDGTLPASAMGKLLPRTALAAQPALFSRDRMLATIAVLSDEMLAGRGLGTEGLDRAADHIAERFREAGLKPAGDAQGSYFQTWEEEVNDLDRTVMMKNVIGVIPGKKPELSGQSVVVGAHYDHLGLGWPDARGENRGRIHPGADDNASGVAVLIELAIELRKSLDPDRSIVFVAFSGEEAGKRGSAYFVSHQQQYPARKCIGMLNLDTVGRLGKNKLLIIGAGSAREWVHIFRGASFVTGVEIETVSEELDSSDQISFEAAGVPAVQLFTGPHADYHRPGDTQDKIDADGLEKVALVAKEVIEYLAGREEPLTTMTHRGEKRVSSSGAERKVSLGAIPDFAYRGRGCRLSGVMPDTPAEACGLREGDVILRINAEAINSLKDLSAVLKSLSPGSRITITYLRNGEEISVETEVKAR